MSIDACFNEKKVTQRWVITPSTMKWQIILDQVKDIELLSNSSPSNIAFGKNRIGVGLLCPTLAQ
jgi:hypothetical protein